MSDVKTYLDYTTEFNDFEKRVLKQIHKLYKNTDYKDYSIWDVAIDFIENFDLDYKDAYDLSNTYYYNRTTLFSPLEPKRRESALSYLFFRFYSNLIDEWIKTKSGNIPNVVINYDDEKIKSVDSQIDIFSSYQGFRLWFEPTEEEFDKYSYLELTDRYGNFYLKFSKIDKEGKVDDSFYYGDREEKEKVDQNKFLVNIEYNIKNGDKNTFQKYYDYPKKLSKETFFKLFDNILEDLLEFLGTNEFKNTKTD